ncbi:hypothetical protein Aperf_G00000057120 [Anoplocephala perfoliata]
MSDPGPLSPSEGNVFAVTNESFTDDDKENIPPGLSTQLLPKLRIRSEASKPGNSPSEISASKPLNLTNSTFMKLSDSISGAQQATPTDLVASNAEMEQPIASNFCVQIHYQVRRPVESWKYNEAATSDGQITYTCSICNSAYKHKKSLNKHWKDKHPNETGPSNFSISTSSEVTFSPDQIPHPRLSAPLQRPRGTARPSLNIAAPTMVKRRRTATPVSEVQLSPLDLSKSRRQEAESSPSVSEEDPCSRRSLTEAVMSSLLQLEAEPSEVKAIDAMSQTTIDALRLLKDQLESILAVYSDRRRSGEMRIHCPICPFVGKWYSELKNHVANHSAHKLFGCGYCLYRSKWRWDVVKHMKKCLGNRSLAFLSNPELMRFIKFFPPPPMDILYGFYSSDPSSLSIGHNQALETGQQKLETPAPSQIMVESDPKSSSLTAPSDSLVKDSISLASTNQQPSQGRVSPSKSPSSHRGHSVLSSASPGITRASHSPVQISDNSPVQLSIALPMQTYCSARKVEDSGHVLMEVNNSRVATPRHSIVQDSVRMTIRPSLRLPLPLPPLRQIHSVRTKLEMKRTPLMEESSRFRPSTDVFFQEDEDKENGKGNNFLDEKKNFESLEPAADNDLLKSS